MSSLEARTHPHLDLTWIVALGLGGSPVCSALQAHAGVGEIQMVHDVGDDSREVHAHLFPDDELLVDAQVQVEISQTTDPTATAATAIETHEQRANVVIDSDRIGKEVHIAFWSGSDRDAVGISTSCDAAISLGTSERGRRSKDAVLVRVSKGGAVFTATVLTVVVGDALERLTCTRRKNGREGPSASKVAYDSAMIAVVRNLIHDEGVEDCLLIEALATVLFTEVEAIDGSN